MRAISAALCGVVVCLCASIALTQDGPLRNGANILVRTDTNGYVLAAAQTYTGPDGPLRTFANTQVRTDANGYLILTNPTGFGGAPTGAGYWVDTANAVLTAERNLGALTTGVVLNTVTAGVGVPSAYAGTSCTTQFVRSLNASGAATCADVGATDFGTQTANFTLIAPDGSAGEPTFRALLSGDLPTVPITKGGTGLITLGGAGTILRSDGINLTYSTATSPNTVADNLILYATGTNVIGTNSGFSFDETTLTLPGQIAFPATQVASAGANTLDDYEEGSWTPVLGGTTSESGQVYTIQAGRYIKIGRQVTFHGRIGLSTLGTITGNVVIKGLPFTSANVTNGYSAISFGFFGGLTTSVVFLGGYIEPNVTRIFLQMIPAAATGTSSMAQGDFSNATDMLWNGFYFTDG